MTSAGDLIGEIHRKLDKAPKSGKEREKLEEALDAAYEVSNNLRDSKTLRRAARSLRHRARAIRTGDTPKLQAALTSCRTTVMAIEGAMGEMQGGARVELQQALDLARQVYDQVQDVAAESM